MVTIEKEPQVIEGIGNSETWVDLYADSLFHYALVRTADRAVAE